MINLRPLKGCPAPATQALPGLGHARVPGMYKAQQNATVAPLRTNEYLLVCFVGYPKHCDVARRDMQSKLWVERQSAFLAWPR